MSIAFGLLVIAGAVYAIARKVEVRLMLLLASLALAFIAGCDRLAHGQGWPAFAAAPMQIIRTFLITFSNEKFVVPICSAMGFAFVLRQTQCDQHLVRLLTRPFERVRPLLVPGAVLVGFFVNVPLISQTSTAVAVGTVLVPLLRAARISPITIGAALMLGASLGGELLNQAAPELRSVAEALKDTYPQSSSADCVAHIARLVWPHLLVSTLVFWFVCWRAERREVGAAPPVEPAAALPPFAINPIKALVPFVPLIILALTSPALNILPIPESWLVDRAKEKSGAFDSRLIGAAMLLGVVAAALTARKSFKDSARSFFEGAGYGFTYIIGLIVAASCFGDGIKLIGLNQVLGRVIVQYPGLLIPLAAIIPLCFGLLSGSGMAATQSLFEFFVEPCRLTGADPFHVGAVVSLGAAAGRTISPVAAVTLMCSNMTEINPFALSRRVAIPALIGLTVVVILAMVI